MADKINAIKIKQPNGSYSDQIPISVLVQNVQWDQDHSLLDALGSVDLSSFGKGNLQHQIDELDRDKISHDDFNSQLDDFLSQQIREDTKSWLEENVNTGQTIGLTTNLTISGLAADAKAVGDAIDAKTFPIDNALSDSSTNPVQNKVVAQAIGEVNESLGDLRDEVEEMSIGSVPSSVRQAIYTLFSNATYTDVGFSDELAAINAWASGVTSLTLNRSTASLGKNGTVQLVATTEPAGAAVTWSSSDPSVATVDSTGLVTSVFNGTCVITVMSGNLSATCSVSVSGFPTLQSISAAYTQSGTVYTSDTLNSLKDNLVVTATYSDSTTVTIPSTNYTLSGRLSVGTSTITVAYGGKTTTFTVIVTISGALYSWDLTNSLVDTVSSSEATLGGSTLPVLTSGTGLVFSGANSEYAVFPSVFATDRTIFIDVDSMSMSTADRNNRFFVCVANSHYHSDTGLMIQRNTNGTWNFYNRTSTAWQGLSGDWITNDSYFAGKTVKIYIDSSSCFNVYADDVFLFKSNAVNFEETDLYLGSGATIQGADVTTCSIEMIVTGVRVYGGEV